MKNFYLFILTACLSFSGVFAQTGAIENLQVAQRTDGSGLVDIHFDLNGTGASYNLQFEASFDDGVNFEPLSETFLTGELTNVLPGAGKHIIWAGKASHPETFSTQTRVRVIAVEQIPLPIVPTVVTAEITNITSNSATSGGNVTDDGGAPVTTRGVVWSTIPNPSLEENEGFTEDGEGVGDFTSEITASSNITYHVRAFATNSVGTAYGENVSFKAASVNPCPDMPTVTDIDGNEYNTVLIGTQCWMAENLNLGVSINGTLEMTDNGIVEKYCYNNSIEKCNLFGGLYQWEEAMMYTSTSGAQGICPLGWHLPISTEWISLTAFLGGFDVAGGKMKETGTNRWNEPNTGADNSSGFTALPGGDRWIDGSYYVSGFDGNWWSSSQLDEAQAWRIYLTYNNDNIEGSYTSSLRGFSIRCVYDQYIGAVTPTITTTAITNITSTSATSGGNVTNDGGAPVTARGAVWSTTPNPTLEVNEGFTEDGEGLGEFTSEITGLQPETMYFVRAYAENSLGIGYGVEISFETSILQFVCGEVLIDTRDNREYSTVQIGDQCWMAQNLNIGTMINSSQNQVDNGIIEKHCTNNIPLSCDLYGGGYQWNEMMQYSLTPVLQGICPIGWHLPTNDEWTNLTNFVSNQLAYLCNNNTAYIAKSLAANTSWDYSSTTCAVGNNLSNNNATFFNALPSLGTSTVWWSSTNSTTQSSYRRGLQHNSALVSSGSSSKTSALSVRCIKNELSVVSSLPISEITSTSATCGGNVISDGGAVVTRGVVWNTLTNPTLTNCLGFTSDGTGTGVFISYLTDLVPGTTYFIKAYSTNSEGTSYGEEFVFTTLTIATVITIPITDITFNSATGGGNITSDGGTLVTSRGVVWSIASNPTLEENNGKTQSGQGAGIFDDEISPLQSGITYYVRAYAENAVGVAYGDVISFSTVHVPFTCEISTVMDIDGNVYGTVQVGNRCWMAENLKTTKYRNGTLIEYPGANNDDWENNTTGAYGWYNNDKSWKDFYGGLYNWYATVNENVLCPDDWHVPTDHEWILLTDSLGGESIAGGKLKSTRTHPDEHPRWDFPNVGATNESNFSALPGGGRYSSFAYMGNMANFWTSNQFNLYQAWIRKINESSENIARDFQNGTKTNGFSVRCIWNEGSVLPTVTTALITDITATTAIGGGNIIDDGGGTIYERGAVWSVKPNPTIEDHEGKSNDGGGSGIYSSIITGTTNTTYNVRAYAINAAGTSYGETVVFKAISINPCPGIPSITDPRDGNNYNTIQIGNQCWLAENLKYLPNVYPPDQRSATEPRYYIYLYEGNNVSEAKLLDNYAHYGVLYNWIAASNDCPEGWHLPTQSEWLTLINSFSSESGKKLKSTRTQPDPHPCWDIYNYADNASGFSFLPGGKSSYYYFEYQGRYGHLWSATKSITGDAWFIFIKNDNTGTNSNFSNPTFGLSVRCVKD